MEFSNSFTVAAPFDRVWSALTQVEEVAPCMPGAQITEMLDEHRFKGLVKIKLGAMQLSYRGEMAMEPDEASRTIVLQGKGTAQGQGSATARVTVTVEPVSDGTTVNIQSNVDVSGRVAAFGRGIMQDVANRLVREFSSCLQQKLADGGTSDGGRSDAGPGLATAPSAPAADPASPAVDSQANSAGGEGPSATSSAPSTASTPTGASGNISAVPARRSPPPAANELKVMDIVMSIVRSRAADGLRALANMIEPE